MISTIRFTRPKPKMFDKQWCQVVLDNASEVIICAHNAVEVDFIQLCKLQHVVLGGFVHLPCVDLMMKTVC